MHYALDRVVLACTADVHVCSQLCTSRIVSLPLFAVSAGMSTITLFYMLYLCAPLARHPSRAGPTAATGQSAYRCSQNRIDSPVAAESSSFINPQVQYI